VLCEQSAYHVNIHVTHQHHAALLPIKKIDKVARARGGPLCKWVHAACLEPGDWLSGHVVELEKAVYQKGEMFLKKGGDVEGQEVREKIQVNGICSSAVADTCMIMID